MPYPALLLLVLLAAPASAAPPVARTQVDLLKLTNFGYLQGFHATDVEFEATYAGPLQQPLVPVPTHLKEAHITAAFLPPRWSEHPMRGTGLVEPLTAFVARDEGDWVFSLRPGSQVVVRGRFEVVTATASVGGAAAVPTDFPLLIVQEVLSVDRLRRMEEVPDLQAQPPGAEDPAAVVRRRARLEAVRGSVAKATPSDLNAEERIRRRELLVALRDRLDAAKVTDPTLRRANVEQALADLAFPPLQPGESP